MDDVRLCFADPARTVIDILAKPAFARGIRHGAEILSAYLNDHDPSLLIEHGDRLGNGAVFKRLGYLVEALAMGDPALISACRERVSSRASSLDPDGLPGGRQVMRWNVRGNVAIVREGAS